MNNEEIALAQAQKEEEFRNWEKHPYTKKLLVEIKKMREDAQEVMENLAGAKDKVELIHARAAQAFTLKEVIKKFTNPPSIIITGDN